MTTAAVAGALRRLFFTSSPQAVLHPAPYRRADTQDALESTAKMALVVQAAIKRNMREWTIRHANELARDTDPQANEKLVRRLSKRRLECLAEIGDAQACGNSQIA